MQVFPPAPLREKTYETHDKALAAVCDDKADPPEKVTARPRQQLAAL